MRAAGAQLGMFGNTAQETLSFPYILDGDKHALSGLLNRFSIHFKAGQLPPASAFWSLTLYQIPTRLLTPNGLERYYIDSGMVSKLLRDTDGGYTLYIQHVSPGADRESNWLPAPETPFYLILRLYNPKTQALTGKWKPPPIQVAPLPTPQPPPSASPSPGRSFSTT